jgi:hypothetical protein
MGIINYTKGNVPYLISYEPYTLDSTNVACDLITDMISFDLRTRPVPTTVNYFVGARSSYVTTLAIKNITLNAKLNVIVEFDNQIFILDKEQSTNKLTVDLSPGQTKEYGIELNKSRLDSRVDPVGFLNNITLTIKNYANGSMIIKSVTTNLLAEKFLPDTINVE